MYHVKKSDLTKWWSFEHDDIGFLSLMGQHVYQERIDSIYSPNAFDMDFIAEMICPFQTLEIYFLRI